MEGDTQVASGHPSPAILGRVIPEPRAEGLGEGRVQVSRMGCPESESCSIHSSTREPEPLWVPEPLVPVGSSVDRQHRVDKASRNYQYSGSYEAGL